MYHPSKAKPSSIFLVIFTVWARLCHGSDPDPITNFDNFLPYIPVSFGQPVSYNYANDYCRTTYGTRLATIKKDNFFSTQEYQMEAMRLVCKLWTQSSLCWIGLEWDGTDRFEWESGSKLTPDVVPNEWRSATAWLDSVTEQTNGEINVNQDMCVALDGNFPPVFTYFGWKHRGWDNTKCTNGYSSARSASEYVNSALCDNPNYQINADAYCAYVQQNLIQSYVPCNYGPCKDGVCSKGVCEHVGSPNSDLCLSPQAQIFLSNLAPSAAPSLAPSDAPSPAPSTSPSSAPTAAPSAFNAVQIFGACQSDADCLGATTCDATRGQCIPYSNENISSGKPAVQSRTYKTMTADRAVDGALGHGSMSHTLNPEENVAHGDDPKVFWRVDLEASCYVHSIKVFARDDDCCRNRIVGFELHLWKDDQATQPVANYVPVKLNGDTVQEYPIGKWATQVEIANGSSSLELEEVEVYGWCPQNIALRKPASQARTYETLTADRANDGAIGTNSMSHTLDSAQIQALGDGAKVYWKVSMGSACYVHSIKVFARSDGYRDRIMGFAVNLEDDTGAQVPDYTPVILNDDLLQEYAIGKWASQLEISKSHGASLELEEVEVYGWCLENVALNKLAQQSTEYYSMSASNAVDGNVGKGHYSHTWDSVNQGFSEVWWQVFLGSVCWISHVEIYNREECCWERLAGFKLELYTGSSLSSNFSPKILTDSIHQVYPVAAVADRVRISEMNGDYLHLREVKVYGWCS